MFVPVRQPLISLTRFVPQRASSSPSLVFIFHIYTNVKHGVSYDFFNISCLKLHQIPGKQVGFSKFFREEHTSDPASMSSCLQHSAFPATTIFVHRLAGLCMPATPRPDLPDHMVHDCKAVKISLKTISRDKQLGHLQNRFISIESYISYS